MVLKAYCGGRRGTANWVRSNMFISAFILVICTAAMIQFAVFSWRAGLLRTIATEPVGEQAELTAEISRNLLNGKDFADASSLQGLCPDLKRGRVNLRSVQVYYSLLKAMSRLGDLIVAPGANGFGGWTSREMALCTQYTAAVLSQRPGPRSSGCSQNHRHPVPSEGRRPSSTGQVDQDGRRRLASTPACRGSCPARRGTFASAQHRPTNRSGQAALT